MLDIRILCVYHYIYNVDDYTTYYIWISLNWDWPLRRSGGTYAFSRVVTKRVNTIQLILQLDRHLLLPTVYTFRFKYFKNDYINCCCYCCSIETSFFIIPVSRSTHNTVFLSRIYLTISYNIIK